MLFRSIHSAEAANGDALSLSNSFFGELLDHSQRRSCIDQSRVNFTLPLLFKCSYVCRVCMFVCLCPQVHMSACGGQRLADGQLSLSTLVFEIGSLH